MVEAKHYFLKKGARSNAGSMNSIGRSEQQNEYIHYETTHLVDETIIIGLEAEETMQMQKTVRGSSYMASYLYLCDPCGKHPMHVTGVASPGNLL